MLLTLALLGIGGTIYKVVAPDGWIVQTLGRSASAGAAAVGSLVMIIGLAWFSRGWHTPRRPNAIDLTLFVFALAGLVYVGQLWLLGAL